MPRQVGCNVDLNVFLTNWEGCKSHPSPAGEVDYQWQLLVLIIYSYSAEPPLEGIKVMGGRRELGPPDSPNRPRPRCAPPRRPLPRAKLRYSFDWIWDITSATHEPNTNNISCILPPLPLPLPAPTQIFIFLSGRERTNTCWHHFGGVVDTLVFHFWKHVSWFLNRKRYSQSVMYISVRFTSRATPPANLFYWLPSITNFQVYILVRLRFSVCFTYRHWFFFLKFFCRTHTHVLFWGHWYPCFGFLVTSPLGFKARVGSVLFAFCRGECNVHSLRSTYSRPLGSQCSASHFPTCAEVLLGWDLNRQSPRQKTNALPFCQRPGYRHYLYTARMKFELLNHLRNFALHRLNCF